MGGPHRRPPRSIMSQRPNRTSLGLIGDHFRLGRPGRNVGARRVGGAAVGSLAESSRFRPSLAGRLLRSAWSAPTARPGDCHQLFVVEQRHRYLRESEVRVTNSPPSPTNAAYQLCETLLVGTSDLLVLVPGPPEPRSSSGTMRRSMDWVRHLVRDQNLETLVPSGSWLSKGADGQARAFWVVAVTLGGDGCRRCGDVGWRRAVCGECCVEPSVVGRDDYPRSHFGYPH